MTHDDYLKRLYILQDQIWKWNSWRWGVELYGLRHTLCCACHAKLVDAFEKTYRNYRAWCRRHHEENLFIGY